MPIYKLTLLRECTYTKTGQTPEVTGWSSNYWTSAATYSDALTAAQALNDAEMALSASTTFALPIRISDIAQTRDIQITPPSTKMGTFTATTPATFDPNLGVRLVLMVAKMYRANHYLRGMDASLFTASFPASFTPSAATDTLFAAYQTAVKQYAFHLKYLPINGVITPQTFPYDQVGWPLLAGGIQDVSVRRSGRPFVQRRGRRRVG